MGKSDGSELGKMSMMGKVKDAAINELSKSIGPGNYSVSHLFDSAKSSNDFKMKSRDSIVTIGGKEYDVSKGMGEGRESYYGGHGAETSRYTELGNKKLYSKYGKESKLKMLELQKLDIESNIKEFHKGLKEDILEDEKFGNIRGYKKGGFSFVHSEKKLNKLKSELNNIQESIKKAQKIEALPINDIVEIKKAREKYIESQKNEKEKNKFLKFQNNIKENLNNKPIDSQTLANNQAKDSFAQTEYIAKKNKDAINEATEKQAENSGKNSAAVVNNVNQSFASHAQNIANNNGQTKSPLNSVMTEDLLVQKICGGFLS